MSNELEKIMHPIGKHPISMASPRILRAGENYCLETPLLLSQGLLDNDTGVDVMTWTLCV